MTGPTKALPFGEFVILLALMVSIVAMATDVMLPALGQIGRDLNVAHPNDAQVVVSSLFAGFAVGQLLVGPLSDSIGRKPAIYLGYVVFIVGCILSIAGETMTTMIAGRVLQGLGAAAPRVVTVSLVRDHYEGRAMARIMSIVMAVFILVPALAPAIGQGVIAVGGWRATFVTLLVLAVVSFAWFGLRQPETLAPERRRPFSLAAIAGGVREAVGYRVVIGYTLTAGLIFGAFVGYLSSAQQIYQGVFALGDMFPVWFAVAALAIGSASVTNSMLVMRLGMRFLTRLALIGLTIVSGMFFAYAVSQGGEPPFAMFMVWIVAAFFCVGLLFGNLNALAMEPLGHMAGLGAALVGAVSTAIALPLGWLVGHSFDGGVGPLVLGFFVLGAAAFGVMQWTERG